ncbi:MAG: precorrin-6A reductase [Lachnospiraceae bacterium]|nr:precorrin-6A reductase [Lachnospiraceae bacterium]
MRENKGEGKKVILFAGTTEGREAVRLLMESGFKVTISVASDLGSEVLKEEYKGKAPEILVGKKDLSELESLTENYDICIDATHPYAGIITENLKKLSRDKGFSYFRLARDKSEGLYQSRSEAKEDNITLVDSYEEALPILLSSKGNILLTTGSKELSKFKELSPKRLFVRVLPSVESIRICEENDIPHKNIIAIWGPFSEELNKALIKQYNIKILVTKDSGAQGGFLEKVKAAKDSGCKVIVIKRPMDPGMTIEEILREIRE